MSFCVDKTLCRHCGTCVAGCVCGLLSLNAEGFPQMDMERQHICVRCGHCTALCPSCAVTLDNMDSNKLEGIGESATATTVANIIKTRRAIRKFLPQDVDKALLEKLFSLAAFAPTAHNAREVAYTVLYGRAKVEKLLDATVELMEKHEMFPGHTQNVRNGRDTLYRGAPCLILIHAPERILSETDCAVATSYMELVLPSLGLGSCWAGMLIEACVHGLPHGLSLPNGHKLYAALMVGIPDISYHRIPYRSEPEVVWK